MGHPLWPLFDLRLTTADLQLRPLTEADLPSLARILPDDLELDPRAHLFEGMERARQRGLVVAQAYWRSLGSWTPNSWAVTFAIWSDGDFVGTQGLEGEDFPSLRTVDSSSFLVPAVRGRGWGKQVRRAVLALAFGPLGAEYAVTSAWHDNVESLGVSRSLGYADNGIERHRRERHAAAGRPIDDASDVADFADVADIADADDMVHLRLTRTEWERRRGAEGIRIEGFDNCGLLFGL